jgi:hypothetical protein
MKRRLLFAAVVVALLVLALAGWAMAALPTHSSPTP